MINNFYKEISFKIDRTKLIFKENGNISQKEKKSTLKGGFEILYPDPQLDQNLKTIANLFGQTFITFECG